MTSLYSYTWTIINYNHFVYQDKKHIANKLYGISDSVLEGWLRCVTDLRNKCAHYSRIYYWIFPALPRFFDEENSPKYPNDYRPANYRRVFSQLYMLKLMYPIKEKWNDRFLNPLKDLMKEYEDSISLIHLGFPPDWQEQLSAKMNWPKRWLLIIEKYTILVLSEPYWLRLKGTCTMYSTGAFCFW